MKQIDCDIIKDLLPSYIDKISSNSTNRLVEEHLEKCEKCTERLKNMSKEIDTKVLLNQEEEIDYLKGYRKKKRNSVVFTIFLTTLILLTIGMCMLRILVDARFFISVDDVNIEFTQKTADVKTGKDIFTFLIKPLNKKCSLEFYTYEVNQDMNNKLLYIKMVGEFGKPAGHFYSVDVDTTINKIYLEDKKGNVLELWNKEAGLLIEDLYHVYK